MGFIDNIIINGLQPYLTQPIWIVSAVLCGIFISLFLAFRFDKQKLKSVKGQSVFAKACLEEHNPAKVASTFITKQDTRKSAVNNKTNIRNQDRASGNILEFYFEYEDDYEI